MSEPVSDKYYFQPLIPAWLNTAIINRYRDYYDGYKTLGDKYSHDPTLFWAGANITVDKVNEYADSISPTIGHMPDDQLIPKESDSGRVWVPDAFEYPFPIDPVPNLEVWWAMCTGLMIWQMYHILLSEQFVRFGNFGHYGSKKKNS